MSLDRVLLLEDPTKLGAYQIATDYGSLRLTPTGAMRVRRWLNEVLPEDTELPEGDDPSEGLKFHVEPETA